MNRPIENFDSAATTPTDERVLKAMIPYFTDRFGNASSAYEMGRKSEAACEVAKTQISTAIGCRETEIFFTSGGTESNNWILRCFPYASRNLAISATEHLSVSKTAEFMATQGVNVISIPVNEDGSISLSRLEELLMTTPIDLVSIHAVNNETGAIQPIQEINRLCKAFGTSFHTDASQAFGKIPLKFDADYMTVSAHKVYGPKGIGALLIKSSANPLTPLIFGGAQQNSMRAGTIPTPLVVGFGAACNLIKENLLFTDSIAKDTAKVKSILKQYGITVNSGENCVPSFINASVKCDSSLVIAMMESEYGIAMSKGAACMTGPSYVLKAMGKSADECRNSLRISLNKFNKKDLITSLPHMIQNCVKKAQKD